MNNEVKDILKGLNEEQKSAVECTEGPVLIVAGAGSGKTKVLTCRIANILSKGCDPDRILALTFTKKAASEMKERIALMVGRPKASRLYMGTFHSIFIRFLRTYASSIGYPESFTIYDTSDSVSAIKSCIKELELDEKVYKPKEVLSRISMAKNNLMTASAYNADANVRMNDTRAKKPRIGDIYALYSRKCKLSGVMDFDDILVNMNILLRDNPTALEELSSRFSYIMVDEYQDTNKAQYFILKKLSRKHENLCVVGDDSQSIYAFRGARVENILNFKNDFPACRLFRLEMNYRSTSVIVNAANSLIAKNENRIPKECRSVSGAGEKIRIITAHSEQEEAVQIVSGIQDLIYGDKSRYEDFAVLYRTNAQSRSLEEALRKRNIPYVVYSGNSFFDRVEIKDMMAYFKLVVNNSDDESFKRIVNKPARGLGDTSIDALSSAARNMGTTLFRAAMSDDLEKYGIRSTAIIKLRSFCGMIGSLTVKLRDTDALELARSVADLSGLYAYFKADTSIEGMSRTSNVEELINSVAGFVEDRKNEFLAEAEENGTPVSDAPVVSLADFLENILLLSNVDLEDEDDTNNKVSLMTVHSAKGLEYKHVFVAGMEENLFPSGGMFASSFEIEEERRLFYVALTRAKYTVTLSYALTRMRNGRHDSNPVSRFLKEIDKQYLLNPLDDMDCGFGEIEPVSPFGMSGKSNNTYRYGKSSPVTSFKRSPEPRKTLPAPTSERYDESGFIPSPIRDFKIGQRIEHNRFGSGLILDITGIFPELKAKIKFDDYPESKIIMLKYAKMRPEQKS